MESLHLSSESCCVQSCGCASKTGVCFPQSCWSLVIKSHWPSRSDSLGIPSPFVRSPVWEVWWGIQNLHNNARLLWYYCSPVCGSPTQWVWNLNLLWLFPSYCLAIAYSLSLDMGYLFLVGSSILLSMDVQQLVVKRICFYLEQCLFFSLGYFHRNTWRSKKYTHFLGDRIPILYFSRLFSVLAFNLEKSFR